MSTTTSSPATDATRDLGRELGARVASFLGAESAADYGDVDAEYAALRETCGWVHTPWIAHLEVRGEDRARFLSGLVSCDVASLEEGQGTYGFATSVKGRILSDLVVLALADRLWLKLPCTQAEDLSAHLGKYIIVDRVEIGGDEAWTASSLIGPKSEEVLSELGDLPAGDYAHRPASLFGTQVHLVRQPVLGGVPAWRLWVPQDAAASICEQLNAKPVGHLAWDRLRIESGQPTFGADFSDANFPQETGIEDAVSYTKGCYLGQEVVARIHYRGGVNRHLRGLRFTDSSESPFGSSITIEGREVGKVTSATRREGGEWIGLGILHQRAEPGAVAELSGGGTARVVELPFRFD